MTKGPRKPLLVNCMLVCLLVFSVLHLYVASYGATAWLSGKGRLAFETADALDSTVFAPLNWYSESNGPGANTLDTFWAWIYWNAVGVPQDWNELSSAIADRREQRDQMLH